MRESTPLTGVDVVLADLDGVVYRGDDPIPHAVESINAIGAGARVGYITNNASRTDVAVAGHLTSFGLTVRPEDVVTSPQAAVALLSTMVEPGSRVLVVGGVGLTSEVERAGFAVVRSGAESPAAVIQGFAPEVGWTELAEASFTLGGTVGAAVVWIATNTDWTIPQARGTAPGNGTLVAAVHTAVGRLPIVAGKPESAIFAEAVRRFGARHPVMLGDRLDTDILGANRAGIDSILVLTGIDGARQALAAVPAERPTYLLQDLRQLFLPYPPTEVTRAPRSGLVTTRVGTAIVARDGSTLSVVQGAGIDLLRAGCAAIWESGVAIYGLEVPPELAEWGET